MTRKRRRRSVLLPSLLSATGGGDLETKPAAVGATPDPVNGEDELARLRRENQLLGERVRLLQQRNDDLIKEKNGDTSVSPTEQRIVIEDFEGEGLPWSSPEQLSRRATAATADLTDEDDELGLSEFPDGSTTDSDEECDLYDASTGRWNDRCPVDGPGVTFLDAMKSRAIWLVGLLAFQSCSGFILARNEALLQDHPALVYFLTMLVGAGGNAGNQASVRVIRGLALGTLNESSQGQFLSREVRMAFALSAVLSAAGFLRAALFHTPFPEAVAVTVALSMIVFSSICLGAVLPLLLQKMGVDPAHSSTTIQVIMDILGVVLTVLVSAAVLDSAFGKLLIKSLGGLGM